VRDEHTGTQSAHEVVRRSSPDALRFDLGLPDLVQVFRLPRASGRGRRRASEECESDERAEAKRNRNYARSDEIRKQLEGAGIVLEDKAGGKTEWRRK